MSEAVTVLEHTLEELDRPTLMALATTLGIVVNDNPQEATLRARIKSCELPPPVGREGVVRRNNERSAHPPTSDAASDR